MSLLQESDWQGRIYSDGWTEGSGAAYPVVSPATGEKLGEMGMATPADVRPRRRPRRRRAARLGRRAVHRAGRGAAPGRRPVARHAEEITGWLMRETGAIGPFGGFQIMTSARGVLRGGGARLRAVRRAAALRPARG